MHLTRIETRSLGETAEAVDLGQDSADCVFLSFADSDLNALAAAYAKLPEPRFSLRMANLNVLQHPYSVDLHLEKTCANAKFVCVRLLGGLDYWRYGAGELTALARDKGIALALLPGDARDDERLRAGSTVRPQEWDALRAALDFGGPDNCAAFLAYAAAKGAATPPPIIAPKPVPAFARYAGACVDAAGAPRALIVFYRSIYLANDLAPIDALSAALSQRGFAVEAVAVTSLKDPAAIAPLTDALKAGRFDAVLNATAFSARLDDGARALDLADTPVLQVVLAGASEEAWLDSARGLSPADLAMNVVLPEIDGRILTRAISFKRRMERDAATQCARSFHAPRPDRVAYVADLAAAYARLRRTPRGERRVAMVLSDYPGRPGRAGAAIGLDTPQSARVILDLLREAGYGIGATPTEPALIDALTRAAPQARLSLANYCALFAELPEAFRRAVEARWGDAADDDALDASAFAFRVFDAGKLIIAVQPDRAARLDRKGAHHDLTEPPRHAYIAFHLWLRQVARVDAMIHLGAHGTLEWLPGKALALSEDCASEVLLGPLPVIYPFIVNDPGEAAQAKRRIGAVTIGHMTPPLVAAGADDSTRELEALYDEYAEAQSLDGARARLVAQRILERAGSAGLLKESGADSGPPEARLLALDSWLCDLKELRIGDGLHVFGQEPEDDTLSDGAKAACAAGEREGLLRALDARFVAPGPAGAPGRGRLDVLPTGRNLYSIDPRAVPTRNAAILGARNAEALCATFAREHGHWPRRIVLDLWGSATTRTGGEEIAQALALMGARPRWDHATNRVSGFDILPLAMLARSRVDVTLRISGFFRDAYPGPIALIDAAIQAIARCEEPHGENPLAEALAGAARIERIFGAAPGAYGIGLARVIASGAWESRDELAKIYLESADHAYSGEAQASPARGGYALSVQGADAYAHVQDLPGVDLLSGDSRAEFEGGFAAAAKALGAKPALYHIDATRERAAVVRPLAKEIALNLRGRAAHPRWIAGQMRHGWRGAMEIADGLEGLFAFAALSECVESRQFDHLFDATLGDETVRGFLQSANPEAARAMAARFDEAERRGFWTARRNSSADILASMLASAA